MPRGFEAIRTVTVHATQREVWDALTNPEKVKQYGMATDNWGPVLDGLKETVEKQT